ncbi:MAG TPA: universal stress protein [Candidatus Dormibacteraeota bacterium]
MILLAVDGEGRSSQALPAVAALALAGRHRVLALHVATSAWAPDDPAPDAAKALAGMGVDAHSETLVVPDGDVAGTLVRRAEGEAAALIALGSRGLSSLGGLVLGSVSHQVLAAARCQVLIASAPPPLSALVPAEISRILVAVDLSPESSAALAAAERLAPSLGAHVLVAHIAGTYRDRGESTYWEALQATRDHVRSAAQRLRLLGVSAEWTLEAAAMSVPRRIASLADDWEADLLVLGSRRHRDLAASVVGSVVHGLCHVTTRPVLVAERPAQPARVAGRRLATQTMEA